MVNISQTIPKGNVGFQASTKLFGLIAFTTLAGVLAGFLLNGGLLLYGAIALVIFLTFFILEVLFTNKQNLLSLTVVLGGFAFALPFWKLTSIYFILAFIVFVAFLFHGAYMGRREMENMVKIRFTRVIHVISSSIITAIVIFLTAVLIMSSNFRVKEERVGQIIDITAPFLGRFVGEFNADTQARAILNTFVERSLIKNEDFQALSVSQKKLIIDDGVGKLKERIEESLGTNIDLVNSVTANVHNIIENKLGFLTPRAQLYLALMVIAVIWISIRSVEFLVYIPLAILVILVSELLFALGFASIQLESRSKEIISL